MAWPGHRQVHPVNILYIAHRIPYPPNKGDKIRAFHEVRALATIADVYLCALVDDPDDWQHEAALRELCAHVSLVNLNPRLKKVLALRGLLNGKPMSVEYFYEKKLQQAVDAVLAERTFDAIVCFSGTSAEYIFQSKEAAVFATAGSIHPRLIMDFCDVDSLKWKEYAQRAAFPLSLLYCAEGQLLARYERKVAQSFDHAILITENEKQLFAATVYDTEKLTVIGNGVDLDYFNPLGQPQEADVSEEKTPELLFVGAMDYHANVDGVCWFAEAVWPAIVERYPKAVFTIVGRNPTKEVLALRRYRNIRVTGGVDDVRPYYQRATMVVVPLRIARGIQNKVLEAMAMAKPVLVSRAAFTGLEAVPERDLLIADSVQDFVTHTVRLLEKPGLREQLAIESRKCVQARYAWPRAMTTLLGLVGEKR